jgi:hypothetical protein
MGVVIRSGRLPTTETHQETPEKESMKVKEHVK